jgi:DNA replication and repair protein RecF
MRIHTIAFKDFRNLQDETIEIGPGANILFGENAQGKTSFLEAAHLCATGRSQRASASREMIRFGADEAHVRINCEKKGSADRIDVHLKRDGKKGAALNQVPIKKIGDLFGNLLVVSFSPEDLKLIKAGPNERRRFMDLELCQMSKVYCFDLQSYCRALRQRNLALKDLRKRPDINDTICVWDAQLIEHGCRILRARKAFTEKISPLASLIHEIISDGRELLQIQYKPNATESDFSEKLKRSLNRDIISGSTSVGLHKDDMVFIINSSDARTYGSQGQQRTASLSCKLAEIALIREVKQSSPVLLLDDVLSELDKGRQRFLLESVEDVQSIITCTGIEDVLKNAPGDSKVFRVSGGSVAPKAI